MGKQPLKELIRLYEMGNRDPELLRQLNEAAWTGFHDPWEASAEDANPPTPTHVDGERSDSGSTVEFDPQAVLPFNLDTIKRYLKGRKHSYWESSQKGVQVKYRYSPEADRTLRITYLVEGKRDHIFYLRWTGDRRVDAERFEQAFRLCNQWNQQFRWPRAYVEIPEIERREGEEGREPGSGLLVLDFQMLMEKGIHQAFFDDLVNGLLSTGWDFWEKAAKAGL